LAFIVGCAIFFAVLSLARYVLGEGYEPLLAADKRTAGALEMPVFSPRTDAATSPAASTSSPPTWNLADHRGKVVVINYFATWCGPCMRELPDLADLKKEFEPRGIVFAAVSLDQDDAERRETREQTLTEFVKSSSFSWPILLPQPDAMIWKTQFPIPQTFLFDKQGRKARSIMGGIRGQGIKASLEELLKEP